MIVTDRFVFIAFPRTGTTFVRNALKELYRRTEPGILARLGAVRAPKPDRFCELILPVRDTLSADRAGRKSQHGNYSQIPAEARHLPVFSIVRNPFDQIVSAYELRFWAQNPIEDVRILERAYPGYPDLPFEQYVAMMHEHGVRDLLKGGTPTADVGQLTLRFLKFYSGEPDRVVASLTDETIDRELFRRDLAPVRFVHTENLVPELLEFLADVGFPPEATEFMRHLPRANVAEGRKGRPWSAYYTPELLMKVRHKERALFRLFPRYDV